MPSPQRNWGYFTYESADGTTYNIRADADWGAIAAHGLAARANGQPTYIASGRRKPRSVTYTDLTTGRSRTGPVGTDAAFNALNVGDTHDFPVPGEVAAVTYTLTRKTSEKAPGSVVATSLPDHA